MRSVGESTKQMVEGVIFSLMKNLENGTKRWEEYYVVEHNRMKMRGNREEVNS